jgi:lysophospholipase L1-like esterase
VRSSAVRLAIVLAVSTAIAACGGEPNARLRVTGVGDSVMLGAADQLEQRLDIRIDAVPGRQPEAGLDAAGALQEPPADVVVIGLGSNGAFTAEQLDMFMNELAGAGHVFFVTVKVPQPWQDVNNAMLEEHIARYPNASLIDWYAATIDHPEYLYGDGVHLTPAGAEAYAELVADAIDDLDLEPAARG